FPHPDIRVLFLGPHLAISGMFPIRLLYQRSTAFCYVCELRHKLYVQYVLLHNGGNSLNLRQMYYLRCAFFLQNIRRQLIRGKREYPFHVGLPALDSMPPTIRRIIISGGGWRTSLTLFVFSI